MSEEPSTCQSCTGMLSNVTLFNQLRSEEGLNVSQTAEDFFAAVDQGCAVCNELYEVASRTDSKENEAFRNRPSPSKTSIPLDETHMLVRNVHIETSKSGPLDVQSVRIALWSAENRYNHDVEFSIYTEAGEAISVVAYMTVLIRAKKILLHNSSPPVRLIQTWDRMPAFPRLSNG